MTNGEYTHGLSKSVEKRLDEINETTQDDEYKESEVDWEDIVVTRVVKVDIIPK